MIEPAFRGDEIQRCLKQKNGETQSRKELITFGPHSSKSGVAKKCMENRNMFNDVAAPDSDTCAAGRQKKCMK